MCAYRVRAALLVSVEIQTHFISSSYRRTRTQVPLAWPSVGLALSHTTSLHSSFLLWSLRSFTVNNNLRFLRFFIIIISFLQRAVELSLSAELIAMLKAVDAGLASVCKRKGKPVNQQEMLRAANETLRFFHWATRASLRIKSLAKFSYISLELVSGVIRRQ